MPVSATGASATISINGVQYHLERTAPRSGGRPRAVVQGRFGPGDASQQQTAQDVPRLWDDWSGGSGYSRRDQRVPNGYAWCIGDARFPGVFAPSGQCREVAYGGAIGLPAATYASFELPGMIGFCAGSQVIQVSSITGEQLGLMHSFASGAEATAAEIFDGKVVVGMTGDFMHTYDIATGVWTRSADVRRDWLAVVYWVVGGVGAYRLVGAVTGTHEIKIFPANPTTPGDLMVDADWSAPYPIGGRDREIRHLVASADHVYVVKTDGVYDIDGRGYAPNLTPYWGTQYNRTNGLTAMVAGDYVYASHVQGLDRVKIGSGPNRDRPEWCHPGVGQSAEGPAFGMVRAVTVDGPWIVAAQFNGTDTYICYGQSRDQPGVPAGVGPILWHQALARIPGVIVTYMRVHEVNGLPWLWIAGVLPNGRDPRMWRMALVRAANPMQALLWPGQYGPANFPWATSATLVMPGDDWGDATAFKTLRRWDIQAQNLSQDIAETYLDLYAAAEDGPFEAQGRVQTNRETLIPSEGVATGYRLTPRVDMVGTATAPALLRALKARASVSVDATEIRVYHVLLGQTTEGLNRARDRRDPEVLFAQLWVTQMLGPIPMRDHRGRDLTVKVENVAQVEEEEPGLAGRRWTIVATVTLSVLTRPAYWDVSFWSLDSTWTGGTDTPALANGRSP